MGVVLYIEGYEMIDIFILLQLIYVLTVDLNLIHFYDDKKEVRLFYINKLWFVIFS